MDKVVLLTNGDMGGTAGDATLILRRARAIYDEKHLFTMIVLLDQSKQGKENTGDYFYSIEICQNKSEFSRMLLKENAKYLVLYGDKIQMMTKSLHQFIKKKNLQTKLLVDIQGAVEEKKEYSSSFVRKYIIYPLSKLSFMRAVNNADGAFVVSDELKQKCEKCVCKKGKLKYYKVRCGTVNTMSVEEITAYRQMFRKQYSLSDETIVFCYSGYRSGWQKVETIIEHFRRYDSAIHNCFFAFFCNTDDEFEKMLEESFPRKNYCVDLLGPSEYYKCLCGCDVGYILRDYNETNRVAFPNKFSDYLTSGLIVALNSALPEPMRVIMQYKTHYIDIDHLCLDDVIDKIQTRKEMYKGFLETSISICEKELLYSSQIRRTDL